MFTRHQSAKYAMCAVWMPWWRRCASGWKMGVRSLPSQNGTRGPLTHYSRPHTATLQDQYQKMQEQHVMHAGASEHVFHSHNTWPPPDCRILPRGPVPVVPLQPSACTQVHPPASLRHTRAYCAPALLPPPPFQRFTRTRMVHSLGEHAACRAPALHGPLPPSPPAHAQFHPR